VNPERKENKGKKMKVVHLIPKKGHHRTQVAVKAYK
jgi:hypothetical protein